MKALFLRLPLAARYAFASYSFFILSCVPYFYMIDLSLAFTHGSSVVSVGSCLYLAFVFGIATTILGFSAYFFGRCFQSLK